MNCKKLLSFIAIACLPLANANASTLYIHCPVTTNDLENLNQQVMTHWQPQQPAGNWCASWARFPMDKDPVLGIGVLGMRSVGSECPKNALTNPQLSYENIQISPGRDEGETAIECVYQMNNSALCDTDCGTQNRTVMHAFVEVDPQQCHVVNNHAATCATSLAPLALP